MPRLHPAARIALFCFGFMLIVCYVRLFISVGILGGQDESYWVAAAMLSSLGGKPYYNELHIQQTASLLYEPLVWLYYKFFGSFAILLFVRHLYFLLSLLGAFVYFRIYRRQTDLVTALCIAALPMVGTSWGEPSMGYNAIGGICFGCGALLAVRSVSEASLRYVMASGIFFFFALAAYPTLVAGLIFLWLLIALSCLYLKKPFLKLALMGNALTAVPLLGFMLSIVWRGGDLGLVYRFSTAQTSLGSFSGKIGYGFFLMLGFAPPLWLLIPFFLLWLVLWKWKGVPWHFFALPVLLFMAWKEPPEAGTYHPPLYMILTLSGLPLVARIGREEFAESWPDVVLFTACLAATVLTAWSSAMTIYVTFVTSTYCMAVLFARSQNRRFKPWLSLSLMLIVVFVFYHKVVHNQTDDHELGGPLTLLEDGPCAGIWTSPQRHKFLSEVQADVDEASKNSKSILFYDEFPLGYLMSSLFPATRTMFMHTLRESARVKPLLREYYFDPAHRPDVIFRFNYFMVDDKKYSVDPAQFKPYEDLFWDYLPQQAEYALFRSRDAYSVFKKRSLF